MAARPPLPCGLMARRHVAVATDSRAAERGRRRLTLAAKLPATLLTRLRAAAAATTIDVHPHGVVRLPASYRTHAP